MKLVVLAAACGLLFVALPPIGRARPVSSTLLNAPDDKPKAADPAPTAPPQAAELSEGEIAAFAKRIHDGEAAEVVRALEKHPAVTSKNHDAEILFGLALSFAGRQREANNIAMKYQGAASSTNIYLLKLHGYSMLAQDDPIGASTFFKLAASRLKNDAECSFNIARCEALTRLTPESLAKAKEFASRKDELPKGQFGTAIGDISLRICNKMVVEGKVTPETLAILQDSWTLAPENVEIPTLLGSLLVEAKEFDKAEELLTQMEKRYDNRLEVPQFLRGRIAEKKGAYKEALGLADVAVQLSNRKYLPALLLKARMAIQLNQLDDARRALDDAKNAAPNNYDARTMMGHYLMERSKEAKDAATRREFLKQAEENLLVAKRDHPFDVPVCQQLVDLYTLWGEARKADLEVAKKDLERAKSLKK